MIDRDALVEIVGEGSVSSDDHVLREYSRDVSLVSAIKPRRVVWPASGDEILRIVQLANTTRTPLVPMSSGTPHFRGDTVPSVGGAVVVDLSRMKKFLSVDRARRVAMVEPGVTFSELIPEAAKSGIRLNMPLMPRMSKSIVGSLLEREPVTMPKYHWDTADPVACFGVVFGSGKEYRTGQSAGPGTIEEQWANGAMQKVPWGPGLGSWHRLIQGAQGTLGIVTWASMRCELLPSLERPFVVGASDLGGLLELMNKLVRLRMVNECFILNATSLAAMMAEDATDYETIKGELPAWILFYNVAGYEYYPEERVSVTVSDIATMIHRLGLAADPRGAVGSVSANAVLRAARQPCPDPYWKVRRSGACEDVFYLTIESKLQRSIAIMKEVATECDYPVSEMGIYLQPVVQGTSTHCEFNLFYDASSQREVRNVKNLKDRAVTSLMERGAFFSRPYGEHAAMIMNRDGATNALLRRMKHMFDPNGIMNPGKICF